MKKIGAKIIVNSITMTRVIGTFLMPFICKSMQPAQVMIYIILLLLTDSIDGYLARKLKVSTIFGALLDALADKLLGISTLALLSRNSLIMLLPIATEIAITLINTGGATKGSSIESSNLGKLKTWVMGVAIVVGFFTIYANDFIELLENATNSTLMWTDIFKYLEHHSTVILNSIAFSCVGADLIVAYDYHSKIKHEVNIVKNKGIDARNIKLKRGKELIDALFNEEYYQETKNEPLLIRLGRDKNNETKIKR